MPNDQNERPGIFSNLLGYAPTTLGVIYGGSQVFRTLQGNHGSVIQAAAAGFKPSTPSMEVAIQAGKATAQAMVNRPLAQGAVVSFKDSLAGGDRGRFLRLGAASFINTISTPGSGFSEPEIERMVQKTIDLTNLALVNGEKFEDARSFMAGILDSKGLSGRASASMKYLHETVKADLSDFMLPATVRREMPSFVERIATPAMAEKIQRAVLSNVRLPGHLKVSMTGGVRVHGKFEFAELTIAKMSRGGPTGQEFKAFIPIGEAARRGIHLTSQFSMFETPRIGGMSGGRRIFTSVQDLLSQSANLSYGELRSRFTREFEAIRSFGTQIQPFETHGQRLRRDQRLAVDYPVEALHLARERKGAPISGQALIDRYKTLGPNIEPTGPSISVRGGVIRGNMLARWFEGMEWMDWSSNPWQSFRDMNWIPSLHATKLWGVKEGAANVMLATNEAYAGPGNYFNRFRPVNPGQHWEAEMLQKYQYVAPHVLQLHVAGKESSKVLEKYGIASDMGQAYVRANMKNALRFEQSMPISVFGVNQAIADKFRASGGKSMLLEPGTFLGNTAGGQFEVIPHGQGAMELVGLEERSGRTTFHIRRVREAMEGVKIQQGAMGGTKTTLMFRGKQFIDEVVSQVMFDASSKDLKMGQMQMLKHVDMITSTSGVFKQGKYGLAVQMTGALKHLVAQQMANGASDLPIQVRNEAMSFLLDKSPFAWLRRQSKAPSYEGFVSTVASFANKWGLKDPNDLGHLFGASFAESAASIATGAVGMNNQELTPGQVAETKIREFFSKGEAENIVRAAGKGNFITWAPITLADTPWDGKGREARLEIRAIDRMMESAWKLGDRPINEALLTGLMKGAHLHDPSQLKTLEYTETAWKAAVGQIPLESLTDDIARMKLENVVSMDVSAQKWFREKGAVIELPAQMRQAAKSVGMGEFLYIPGEGAVGRDLVMDDVKIAGMDGFRDAQGQIGKQHYRAFIDDAMRDIGNVMHSQNVEEQTKILKNLQTGMFGWMKKSVEDALKIRLGPGSGHVQAMGLNDYAAMVKTAEWKSNPYLREEAVSRLGEGLVQKYESGGFATERQLFLTRAQAESMVKDVDFSKLGMTSEEFMTGQKGLFGAVWRNPTVMQTSVQPAEVFVSQGRAAAEPLVYVPTKEVGGIAPGQKLDFDKDMLNIKLITDDNSIRQLMGSKEEWRTLERQYEKHILDRQIMSKALSKRMTEMGLARAGVDVLKDEFEKQFGPGGIELYEKALGAHRLRTGKDVGAISKIIEEVMFAMGRPGGTPEMNAMMNIILSEAEETGTLKARKAKGLVDISERLVASFRQDKEGDITRFLSTLHEEFLGTDFAQREGVSSIFEGGTVKSMDELFTYTAKRYNEYKGTEAQSVFRAFFTGRDMPMAAKVQAYNSLINMGSDISPSTAYLGGIRGTPGGKFGIASELGLSAANAGTIAEGAQQAWKAATKHIPGPMLLGLLGSAAAFSVLGSPGANEPLGPGGTLPSIAPGVLPGLRGSMSSSPQPSIESFTEQGGGPSPTGQLNTPSAPISPMTHQVSVDVPTRDLSSLDYNGISRALRSILPYGNISSRISDNRRPMAPNDLYRDGF